MLNQLDNGIIFQEASQYTDTRITLNVNGNSGILIYDSVTDNIPFRFEEKEEPCPIQAKDFVLVEGKSLNKLYESFDKLKARVDEMEKMLRTVWYNPYPGGPGYQEGLRSWNKKMKNNVNSVESVNESSRLGTGSIEKDSIDEEANPLDWEQELP